MKNNDKLFHTSFVFLLIFYIGLLVFNIQEISIHYKESYGFFFRNDFIFDLARWSYIHLGRNDLALRLPFLTLHICNVILMYLLSLQYLKIPSHALLCVGVFMFLPGMIISSFLLSKSNIVIFATLLYLYIHMRYKKELYIFLIALSFVDVAFSVLFVGIFLHGLRDRRYAHIFVSMLCLMINLNIIGTDVNGRPKNYFIDLVGIISTLFSPALLVYYIYALIHAFKRQEYLAYISLTSIVFVLLFSVRQNVDIMTFLPLSVVGFPVLFRMLISDIKVHLKVFRKPYIARIAIIIGFMFLQSGIIYANKILYVFDMKNYFTNYYYGKEIATKLKEMGITNIVIEDKKLALQLKFYGIENKGNQMLQKSESGNIDVIYLGKKIASYKIVDIP